MYMAYGWPQVIPVNTGVRPSVSSSDGGGIIFSDRIIYLKIINRLLLLVTPTHLQLWSCSQHKVRIGKCVRDGDSVRREGENLQAIWSPDTKTIAVLTSSAFFHIYKVQFSGKRLLIGGKQPSGLFLANISLVITEKAPFLEKNWTTSNFVCDNKSILIGLSNGHFQLVTWNAEGLDGGLWMVYNVEYSRVGGVVMWSFKGWKSKLADSNKKEREGNKVKYEENNFESLTKDLQKDEGAIKPFNTQGYLKLSP